MKQEIIQPFPGSVEAESQGCTCPMIDNHHGKGRYGDHEKYGWFVYENCPLHGEQPEITGNHQGD